MTRPMEYIILEGLTFISSHMAMTRGHTRAKRAVMLGMNWPSRKVTSTYPARTLVKEPLETRYTSLESFSTIWVLPRPAAMMNMEIMVMTVLLPMLERAVFGSTHPVTTSASMPRMAVRAMGNLWREKLTIMNRNTTKVTIIRASIAFFFLA